MNLLDENIPESQRRLLLQRHIHVRQIGLDLGYKGLKDHEIIPLLHTLTRPTFFTFDSGFYRMRLCHPRYCLIWLEVEEDEGADFIRRTLRHHALNSRTKRMGTVVHVAPAGISFWRFRTPTRARFTW